MGKTQCFVSNIFFLQADRYCFSYGFNDRNLAFFFNWLLTLPHSALTPISFYNSSLMPPESCAFILVLTARLRILARGCCKIDR